jgi:hypothetical protein
MLTAAKKLFLLLLVLSIAACAAPKPISKGQNPNKTVTSADPTSGPSDESLVLFTQPLVSEPPFAEPIVLP